MSNPLADKLQLWGFEKNYMIYSDGSLGFALEVNPVDVSCKDIDGLNSLASDLCQFLNGLPDKVDLQFIQDIHSGNDNIVDENERLCYKANDPLVKDIGQVRVDFYRDLDKSGLLPKHSLKLIIRKPMSKPLIKKANFFSKEDLFPEISSQALEEEIRKIEQLRDDMMASLSKAGFQSTQMQSNEILKIVYNQWNPCVRQPLESYDQNDVRNSILFTDVSVHKTGFYLADMEYRVLSLKILPQQTFASMASVLRGLPFDSRLQLTINVPNQQKEIESLQLQRRLAFSMVYGKTSGVSDLESEAKLEDLESLLSQMISNGEKVFHVGLNVILRDKSKLALDEKVSQTLLKIRELSGAEAMEESLAAFDIFSNIALPNARASERVRRLKTSNLADLLPVYGPWTGHLSPKVLLRSRMGSLVKFNPFSQELTNANQIISGGSGSGKSFLTNLLLIQMLKEDPQIFIVDIGGSYKKTCENLSGQYVPLGVDQGLCINPFDLKPEEQQPSNEKIKFLLALVETITKEDGEKGLKKLERSELETAIQKVYDESKSPRLSDLKTILLSHDNLEMKRLGKILTIWCGDTPYGRFLDRPTNVSLHKSTICFDLKGLEQYEDLQRACLLMISDMIIRDVQSNKTRMKFLIFDECWKLLEDGEGSKFIAEIFRTCRKYFMSCIAISQNIDDFAQSKVSSAIMSNSSIKWILKQKGADKTRLQKVLDLNDTEIDHIFSLHQVRGVYSESFLICEDKKSVVAIESTPPEYWLATTDPRDIAALEKMQDENPDKNQGEILFMLANKYPNGFVDNLTEKN